jgi:AcrR family transcriptional regulator
MPRPRAADHDAKRRAILSGAARLFADQGYGRASMAGVAAACGISKGLIYHYYDGKDALLFDILDTHLRDLRDRVAALPPPASPRDGLRDLFEALLLAYEGRDAEHEVQLNALHALPEAQQAILRGHQREMVAIARARVAALSPAAVAADAARLRAVTMSVFALANWHHRWDGAADAESRRAYAELATTLIAGGLPALAGETP